MSIARNIRIGPLFGPKFGVNADTTVTPPSTTTLTVAITDSVDPVITVFAMSYAVAVTNTGAVDATSVTATVTLDASLTFVSGSGTGWAVNAVGQVVTCTRATLAVGAAPTITVNVTTGGSATTATSTADAIASNADAATQANQATTVKLVSIDATSLIRCPASATEWTDFLAFFGDTGGNPSILYLCQEASGNLLDSIGAFNQTTSAGSPAITYANTIAGWSRKGVGPSGDNSTGSSFNNSASLPDISTTSCLMLCYAILEASPASTRRMNSLGTTTRSATAVNTTPRIVATSGANTATGTNAFSGAVHLFWMKVDRAAGTNVWYTDQEKLAPTIGAVTGKQFQIIGGGINCPQFKLLYCVGFVGAAAELSDAIIKTRSQNLGWTIPWT